MIDVECNWVETQYMEETKTAFQGDGDNTISFEERLTVIFSPRTTNLRMRRQTPAGNASSLYLNNNFCIA